MGPRISPGDNSQRQNKKAQPAGHHENCYCCIVKPYGHSSRFSGKLIQPQFFFNVTLKPCVKRASRTLDLCGKFLFILWMYSSWYGWCGRYIRTHVRVLHTLRKTLGWCWIVPTELLGYLSISCKWHIQMSIYAKCLCKHCGNQTTGSLCFPLLWVSCLTEEQGQLDIRRWEIRSFSLSDWSVVDKEEFVVLKDTRCY